MVVLVILEAGAVEHSKARFELWAWYNREGGDIESVALDINRNIGV
jgi:hypothetical protein